MRGDHERAQELLAQDPRLAGMVKRTRELPAAATHFERIRIGEAIAGAVQVRRARDEETLVTALRPLALAFTVSQPHHERAVLNAAFLIERSAMAQFDGAVQAASDRYGSDIEFKLVGPMPPYSFVDRAWESTDTGELQPAWA